jgi:hypothetical protein
MKNTLTKKISFSQDTLESFYWAGFLETNECIKIRGKYKVFI